MLGQINEQQMKIQKNVDDHKNIFGHLPDESCGDIGPDGDMCDRPESLKIMAERTTDPLPSDVEEMIRKNPPKLFVDGVNVDRLVKQQKASRKSYRDERKRKRKQKKASQRRNRK